MTCQNVYLGTNDTLLHAVSVHLQCVFVCVCVCAFGWVDGCVCSLCSKDAKDGKGKDDKADKKK